FAAYLNYLALADEIKQDKIFEELHALTAAVFQKLAVTEQEKAFVNEALTLQLAGKLVKFELTPDEWEEYKNAVIPAKAWIQVSNLFQKNVYSLDSRFRGNDDLKSFERFYELAEARNQKFMDNLLAALIQHQKGVGVVVAGGFH